MAIAVVGVVGDVLCFCCCVYYEDCEHIDSEACMAMKKHFWMGIELGFEGTGVIITLLKKQGKKQS